MTDLFKQFSSGRIAHMGNATDAQVLPWNPHPAFTGVNMKHLVTGKETDGQFSVHLVRLDAGAEIGEHVHEASWELHEIAGGDGHCQLEGTSIPYGPGVMAVIPENRKHSVRAGGDGLLIMAKFIPALL